MSAILMMLGFTEVFEANKYTKQQTKAIFTSECFREPTQNRVCLHMFMEPVKNVRHIWGDIHC